MSNDLFGTDGARGIANTELTCITAYRLGLGAAKILGPRLVIGRDTRLSGTMLESALVAGIMAAGGTPLTCGVIPTPAVALLTVQEGADGGVVISASHNPSEYNGIKFFGPDGMKATDEVEDALAEYVEKGYEGFVPEPGRGVGSLVKLNDARERYIAHAIGSIDCRLDGLKVAIDCAHGASCVTTPAAFAALGAQVIAFNTEYDGLDINAGCGSTHLDALKSYVASTGADFGIAHDGDADRVLFVDGEGNDVDGDQVLAICAAYLKERGELDNNEVVVTSMSNLGFAQCMERLGINMPRTDVGDKYVLRRMLADGAVLGGEQSGHVIFWKHNTTGDGLLTAIQLAGVVKASGRSLGELSQVMKRFPQVLVNVRTSRKNECRTNAAIQDALRAQEELMAGDGRILLRPSGTEPLVRVMVEASELDIAQGVADAIADVIRAEFDC